MWHVLIQGRRPMPAPLCACHTGVGKMVSFSVRKLILFSVGGGGGHGPLIAGSQKSQKSQKSPARLVARRIMRRARGHTVGLVARRSSPGRLVARGLDQFFGLGQANQLRPCVRTRLLERNDQMERGCPIGLKERPGHDGGRGPTHAQTAVIWLCILKTPRQLSQTSWPKNETCASLMRLVGLARCPSTCPSNAPGTSSYTSHLGTPLNPRHAPGLNDA